MPRKPKTAPPSKPPLKSRSKKAATPKPPVDPPPSGPKRKSDLDREARKWASKATPDELKELADAAIEKRKSKPKRPSVRKTKPEPVPETDVDRTGRRNPAIRKRGKPREHVAGKPEHEPTDETTAVVRGLVINGVEQERIAKYLGIDPKTLRKHYRQILDEGMDVRIAEVADNLFQTALGHAPHSVSAAIFILKTKAGWKEPVPVEHSGGITIRVVEDSETERTGNPDS